MSTYNGLSEAVNGTGIPNEQHYAIVMFTTRAVVTSIAYGNSESVPVVRYLFTHNREQWIDKVKEYASQNLNFAALDVKSKAKVSSRVEVTIE